MRSFSGSPSESTTGSMAPRVMAGTGKAEREIYESALLESATELTGLVRDGDVVYLHDPQTAGLAPHIKASGINVVWRCHVGLDHPNELAREAWSFLSR